MTSVEIIQGDVLSVLKTLPDNFVQCVVTSPPYYNLRDYGTAKWNGGDPECDHSAAKEKSRYDYSLVSSPIQDDSRTGTDAPKWKDICSSCGAIKIDSQIGLEKTPEEYVEKIVDVCREIRRVLRNDGTFWLNLGDSYNGSGKAGENSEYQVRHTEFGKPSKEKSRFGKPTNIKGLKHKDIIGIPWRVAFALQADGWWLRQDIIWSKPNPMPESVTDRCTKSHEYIFLLTKSAHYYYDAEAIKEKALTDPGVTWDDRKKVGATAGNWYASKNCQRAVHGDGSVGSNLTPQDGKRNHRSVWNITTKPFKGAHFAVFPPEIPETCIKAGTSLIGCCPICKSPVKRVIKRNNPSKESNNGKDMTGGTAKTGNPQTSKGLHRNNGGVYSSAVTDGWEKTCEHIFDPVPCTVLDPFSGSGTTGFVAKKLGRDFIGIELNPEYIKISKKRLGLNSGLKLFFD